MFPGGLPMPEKYQQNTKLESETKDNLRFKPNQTKTVPMLRRGKFLRPSKFPITLFTLQQLQK